MHVAPKRKHEKDFPPFIAGPGEFGRPQASHTARRFLMDGVGDNPVVPAASSSASAATEQREFCFSDEPSMEDLRAIQAEFAKERDWDKYHQPRNLLLAMVGEVGELSELFQWRGECKEGLKDWSDKDRQHLGQEMSDVLIYLIRLADKCHIDLPKAALEKVKLNAQKYPANKVYGSMKKYTEYHT